MRLTFALLTIGAILTGQLDSTPLSTVTTHGTTHATSPMPSTTEETAIGIELKKLNEIKECDRALVHFDVYQTCETKVGPTHLYSGPPLDTLMNQSSAADRLAICGEFIQMAECVNEEACRVCYDYNEVLRFGENWFEKALEIAQDLGCPEYNKSKCQENLIEQHFEELVDDDWEETGLSATSITIIVVIGLAFILGGMLLYCILFGPSAEEGADEGKSAKEGVSEGKGAKSASAKSASAPKSAKIGEASTKSKLPSVAKSTIKSAIKSAIAAGAKSKIKSSVAETKTASKVSSKGKV